ncbi:Uncharacterized membrane-anchored protein YjiN, DUF445 family [Paenibacillus sophorae]|uniref:DUF445 domain-containing protein n=1 Tax=Paenibacillus sophorae TaxID=1333845 RepID=A0A1H8PEE2_9BACL|nr:DUF445 domain-containing protein [Paenibacillus sophorae]QWU16548.1 DUF445 domain-containing protein [Paenibacillus sophorae]SEO40322.1 Uncharacterized membrane-anchored protein YjiN, DUF445 family [Paenibacillus sophorae]
MKSRNLATISLVVMACGFLLTLFLPENTAVKLLRGGFEAGLVGGIADWFAVTALFRHPLGLPIPHTSLLLKNRNKIVGSLISAMENELLNKESIENKLRGIKFISLGSSMLTKFFSRKQTRMEILARLSVLVSQIPAEKALPYLQSALAGYVRNADLKKTADTVVTRLLHDGRDKEALDYGLGQAEVWISRPETKAMLGQLASSKLAEVKLGGLKGVAFQAFVGFVDEEMLGELLQNMLRSAIRDIQDEDNVYREDIIREVRVALFQLVNDEERMKALADWAAAELEGQEAGAFLLARLEEIRGRVLALLEEDRFRGGRGLFAAYALLARRIAGEKEWISEWESKIRSSLIAFAEANHYRIGVLVKENLDKMDDASLVAMLEQKVGKDLQWIRVNGAVCGFVVGLALTLIQWIPLT